MDLFVLGDGLLASLQLQRRIRVRLPGGDDEVWVTSADDQILRNLDRSSQLGGVSDRQWRDIVGLLAAQADFLDFDGLDESAQAVGLAPLLLQASNQAQPNGG